MALFTSNLNRPFLMDMSTKKDDRLLSQRLIEPVTITEQQYKEINKENMKNRKFAENYSEMTMARERYDYAAKEAKQTFNELNKWRKMLECWPEVIKEVQNGKTLTGAVDKQIYELKEEGLNEKIQEALKKDEQKSKEKDRLKDKWMQADRLWKEHALTECQPFAYQSEEKYFRIGGGAIKLNQKPQQSLDEIGSEFRDLFMEEDTIRKINYTQIVSLLRKYEKACPTGTHDQQQISEVLNFVRDNPKISRIQFIEEAFKIANAELRTELATRVIKMKKDKEANDDLESSIDPDKEREQQLRAGRTYQQQLNKMQNILRPVQNFLPAADKNKYKLTTNNSQQFQRGRGRGRGNYRGGYGQNQDQRSYGQQGGNWGHSGGNQNWGQQGGRQNWNKPYDRPNQHGGNQGRFNNENGQRPGFGNFQGGRGNHNNRFQHGGRSGHWNQQRPQWNTQEDQRRGNAGPKENQK